MFAVAVKTQGERGVRVAREEVRGKHPDTVAGVAAGLDTTGASRGAPDELIGALPSQTAFYKTRVVFKYLILSFLLN